MNSLFYYAKSKLQGLPARGFSLVELLVYLGSMTVVLLALSYILASTYGIYASTAASARADRSAGTLMQILATEIRTGAVIDQANSVFNAAEGQLTIDAFDGVNEVEKVFLIEEGRVLLVADGEETLMTPADMQVSKFLFTQIVTDASYAVRYELDLTYEGSSGPITKSYPGVVVLRRSYE